MAPRKPSVRAVSLRQKLIVVGLFSASLVGWAIYVSGANLFDGHDLKVALAVQLISLLYLVRLLVALESR